MSSLRYLSALRERIRAWLDRNQWRRMTAGLDAMPASLSSEEVARFDRDGYIVVPGLLSQAEIDTVRRRLDDLLNGRVRIPRGAQFELEPGTDGAAAFSKARRYRQISDFVPHDRVLTEATVVNPKIVSRLKSLLGRNIELFRATAMLKQAGVGTDLPYHQDSAYWPIEPRSLVSCWIAIDDAVRENGCMRVIPGGHKRGLIEFRTESIYRKMDLSTVDLANEVHLEMKRGDCLLFHSLLPHATGPNRSARDRFAVIGSYMPAGATYVGEGARPQFFRICSNSFE